MAVSVLPIDGALPAWAAGLQRFAALPDWLAAAVQPERVRAALARRVPEFAAGELRLLRCEPEHPRLKAGRWAAQYRLTIERPGSGERRSVRLRGRLHPPGTAAPAAPAAGAAFGAEGWRCYLPELRLELWPQPPEAAPPALPLLTEPEAARALLERSIRSGSPRYRDLRLRACTPSVVRHRLGRHCTVVYRLTYPAGLAAGRGWPDLVVAKAYHGDEGRTAYAAMRALWHSPLRTGGVVSIAEPLAYVPELRVLVQGPVRGDRTLKQLIPAALRAGTPGALAELDGYVRRAAAGLAALHRSGAAPGPTWSSPRRTTATRAEPPLPPCAPCGTRRCGPAAS